MGQKSKNPSVSLQELCVSIWKFAWCDDLIKKLLFLEAQCVDMKFNTVQWPNESSILDKSIFKGRLPCGAQGSFAKPHRAILFWKCLTLQVLWYRFQFSIVWHFFMAVNILHVIFWFSDFCLTLIQFEWKMYKLTFWNSDF